MRAPTVSIYHSILWFVRKNGAMKGIAPYKLFAIINLQLSLSSVLRLSLSTSFAICNFQFAIFYRLHFPVNRL